MFWLISLVAVPFIGLILYKFFYGFFFDKWLEKIKDKHDYDEDSIRSLLTQLSSRGFQFSNSSLPYGRAKWFVEGNDSWAQDLDADTLEYFGYSPIRSQLEDDFSEYGLLLTQNGLYYKLQEEQEQDGKKCYRTKSEFFPFDGLWRVTVQEQVVSLYYPRKIRKFQLNVDKKKLAALKEGLNRLIKTGYTADLHLDFIEKQVSELTLSVNERRSEESAVIGSLVGLNMLLGKHLKNIQFNPIANGRMGHGYAAEYANDRVDQLKNPFLEVKQVGQSNQKNGADRIVGDQQIQTKYHSRAVSTINSAFDSKVNGGQYRYQGMQLEVPKDQYNESIQIMKKKIQEGKVPGHTDPKDAYNIIRKGSVTYNEAKLIAKGGNITSLKYDALDGAIQSLPVAGISFVIVFAQAKWSGHSTQESASLALRASVKTIVVGTIVYSSSQQIGKLLTPKIVSLTGKKVAAQVVAQRAAGVISFGIVVGPDLFDALMGRISSQQLLKNTLVAGGGALGGALVGAAAGSVLPVVGTLLGAMAGATAGTLGAKNLLDHFIEDDRVEMFAILKEEFIDVVMSMSLSEQEFKAIQEAIFDKELTNRLKDMFQKKQTVTNRNYTRETIVEKAVEQVISKRHQVKEQDILEAVEVAAGEYAVL